MENRLTDEELCTYVADQCPDVEDLCALLELDSYDIALAFVDVVRELRHKFILPETTEGILDDDEATEEEEGYLEEWDKEI